MRHLAAGLALVMLISVPCLLAPTWSAQAQLAPAAAAPTARSVQDALLQPLDLPFEHDTPLATIAEFLAEKLGAPVVLDRAALARLEITPETPVRLALKGVRLKTGLQLLLDQVDMTYRVVAEDNLLILTDNSGADEPLQRVQAELAELHNDVHDLQDALDRLSRMFMDPANDSGVPLKNPTIIEEAPAAPGDKPEAGHTRPG